MKAILVIDKPKDCFTCELGGSKVCIGGCPLKPLPKKRNYSEELADTRGFDMYMEGWNDCLEEIEE